MRVSGDAFVTLGQLRLCRPWAAQSDLRPPCQRNPCPTNSEADPTCCVVDRPVQGANPRGIVGISDQNTHKGEEADEADDERRPSFEVDRLAIRLAAPA